MIGSYDTGVTRGPVWSPERMQQALAGIKSYSPPGGAALGGVPGLQAQHGDLMRSGLSTQANLFSRNNGAQNINFGQQRDINEAGLGRAYQGYLTQANQQANNQDASNRNFLMQLMQLLG